MKSADDRLHATGMFQTTAIRSSAFTSGSCGIAERRSAAGASEAIPAAKCRQDGSDSAGRGGRSRGSPGASKVPAPCLLGLERLEKGLEVPLPERPAPAPADDLEKQRRPVL